LVFLKLKNPLLMLMAHFYVCKMVEIHDTYFKKYISLIFILSFKKNRLVISKIELKKFQKNLMLELFFCLRLELL